MLILLSLLGWVTFFTFFSLSTKDHVIQARYSIKIKYLVFIILNISLDGKCLLQPISIL